MPPWWLLVWILLHICIQKLQKESPAEVFSWLFDWDLNNSECHPCINRSCLLKATYTCCQLLLYKLQDTQWNKAYYWNCFNKSCKFIYNHSNWANKEYTSPALLPTLAQFISWSHCNRYAMPPLQLHHSILFFGHHVSDDEWICSVLLQPRIPLKPNRRKRYLLRINMFTQGTLGMQNSNLRNIYIYICG